MNHKITAIKVTLIVHRSTFTFHLPKGPQRCSFFQWPLSSTFSIYPEPPLTRPITRLLSLAESRFPRLPHTRPSLAGISRITIKPERDHSNGRPSIDSFYFGNKIEGRGLLDSKFSGVCC